MALAYGDFHALTHQLRFMLFEIGIGLPQRTVEYFIGQAHRECLKRLQHTASLERLITSSINSHHIHDFIDQLQEQLKQQQPASRFFNWQALKHELDETVANEAMAQAYRQCWQLELSKQAKGFSNFWEWLCEKNVTETVQFLEQWGCLGQLFHPNFRTKIGFSRREVLQYSPEFNAQFSLHWCALHQRQAYFAAHGLDYKRLMAEQFPKEYQLWQSQLLFKHYDPEHYLPLPLHPWQWRNQIQHPFSQLIDSKDLILLPHLQLVRPSMSFHTVMPQTAANACYLKLAMAVQTTSTRHLISQDIMDGGPRLSPWINHLLEKHGHYQQSLFITADKAGLRVNHATVPESHGEQLAVILRENPLSKQKNGQIPVPLGALFAQSPLSGKPLLIDILDSSNLSPDVYFRNYCQKLLTGQLHLLLNYGIVLETHSQNVFIVFDNHRPSALIIRDLENASLCLHRLYGDVEKPKLSSESKIVTNNLTELGNRFVHGNFQSNLAPWINTLNHHYGFATNKLWQIVREELRKLLDNFASEINSELLNFFKDQLLVKEWQHTPLLTMRLHKDNKNYTAFPIFNPLSQR
ncbi:IucA/IucC family protein [Legionella jamestowniensis]|uniref:FrgA protein n=1 Tax=Legionella jamestowniensis TaxID=455 RepID=A0A0W0UI06_9GAMM|nr:IucA/IucC family protein [Legionella jamestowniensis]KTD07496.1 FrgA protein [Legionella jamestowniensis]OCH97729.1 hypothetical protein A8135_02515 [Legionella jamestowniensis]SFM00885.1 Siderophore synthetase component [Legionella jamestowniensis DSM 19215]